MKDEILTHLHDIRQADPRRRRVPPLHDSLFGVPCSIFSFAAHGGSGGRKPKKRPPTSHSKNNPTLAAALALACPSVVRTTKVGRARLWVCPELPRRLSLKKRGALIDPREPSANLASVHGCGLQEQAEAGVLFGIRLDAYLFF